MIQFQRLLMSFDTVVCLRASISFVLRVNLIINSSVLISFFINRNKWFLAVKCVSTFLSQNDSRVQPNVASVISVFPILASRESLYIKTGWNVINGKSNIIWTKSIPILNPVFQWYSCWFGGKTHLGYTDLGMKMIYLWKLIHLRCYLQLTSCKKISALNQFIKSISYVESNEMVPKYLNFDKRVKYMI